MWLETSVPGRPRSSSCFPERNPHWKRPKIVDDVYLAASQNCRKRIAVVLYLHQVHATPATAGQYFKHRQEVSQLRKSFPGHRKTCVTMGKWQRWWNGWRDRCQRVMASQGCLRQRIFDQLLHSLWCNGTSRFSFGSRAISQDYLLPGKGKCVASPCAFRWYRGQLWRNLVRFAIERCYFQIIKNSQTAWGRNLHSG